MAILLFFPCLSITVTLAKSLFKSGILSPLDKGIFSNKCSVIIFPSKIPITLVSSDVSLIIKSELLTDFDLTEFNPIGFMRLTVEKISSETTLPPDITIAGLHSSIF